MIHYDPHHWRSHFFDIRGSMLREIFSRFLPNKIVMLKTPGLEILAPFVKDKIAVSGKSTAYVCRDHACRLPVTDAEELKKLL